MAEKNQITLAIASHQIGPYLQNPAYAAWANTLMYASKNAEMSKFTPPATEGTKISRTAISLLNKYRQNQKKGGRKQKKETKYHEDRLMGDDDIDYTEEGSAKFEQFVAEQKHVRDSLLAERERQRLEAENKQRAVRERRAALRRDRMAQRRRAEDDSDDDVPEPEPAHVPAAADADDSDSESGYSSEASFDEHAVAPPAPPQAMQQAINLQKQLEYEGQLNANNGAQLWALVQRLNWRDRDEQVRTEAFVKTTIEDPIMRAALAKKMLTLMGSLQSKFENLAEFNALPQDRKYAFLSHIIAKGKEFYQAVMIEPVFAQYLLSNPPKYQDLYGFLKA